MVDQTRAESDLEAAGVGHDRPLHADEAHDPGFWRETISAMADGLTIIDARGVLVETNPAFCRMVGFDRSELIGTAKPFAYWPPDDVARLDAVLASTMGGAALHREWSIRRKDGTQVPVLVHTSRLSAGGAVYAFATFRDISEQRRMEETLRRSEERWRSIAENPYDFVAIIDEHYRYTYLNHTAPGFRKEDLLLNNTPLDFIDPRHHPIVHEAFSKAFREGVATTYEIYVDLIGRWMSTIVGPIRSDGHVTAVSLLTRDVTDIRRAEQALRQIEDRLQLALSGGDVGAFDVDMDAGTVFTSPRLLELLGYAPDDATFDGSLAAFPERLHPDDAERAMRLMSASLQNGELFDTDYRLRLKSGGYRWFHVRARTVKVNGAPHFSGFLTDISARKQADEERAQLEAQLRHVQKLDTLGRLAAGMAHDLNNLLVPILGNAELVLNQLAPSSPIRGELEDIVRAATQARELSGRILVFGRQTEDRQKRVKITSIVREALRFLQASLPPRVEVKAHIDETCPPVTGLAGQIHQAVTNLCTNAFQALQGTGGLLEVTVEQVLVDETFTRRHPMRTGPAVRVTVKDDGPGMTSDVLERAFEPFFTTKAPGEGSGLGLSLVHGIVAKHGGVVAAWSKPGQGARFELYFPAHLDPEEGEEPISAPIASTRARVLRVLCIDDEPAVLRVVSLLLRRAGHEVSVASASRDGLDLVTQKLDGFDLVITDQTMPKLTGIELAAKLFELNRDLPVILLSGYAEAGWLETATPNVRLYLQKPFDAAALLNAVERATQSPRRS